MSNCLKQVVEEINIRSKNYEIGNLQKIRKEIKGLKQMATHDIFTSASTFDDWAFHYGGRKELQFNVGFEELTDREIFRFGIAFSFEPSRSLPDIDVLVPKVALFNEYMKSNLEQFADMQMWHFQDRNRSSDYPPTMIQSHLVSKGVFVFLGIYQTLENLNYDEALEKMDSLLPLYLYVETNGNDSFCNRMQESLPFHFKPGCADKKSSANASLKERKINIQLRHNDLQKTLYEKLCQLYGRENVGAEQLNGGQTSVDLVLKQLDKYWYYEIKTASTAKECIRQAMGQLLEYSYWPKNQEADKLVIVGEPKIDEDAKAYLNMLKNKFNLPLEYQSI